jgi:hypothetical protein
MNNHIFLLRPHHLVCLLSFQGKGYSEVFVSKTSKIIETMKTAPKKKLVSVINGCDDICEYCPKNSHSLCKDEDKVSDLDAKFSQKLNFFEGNILSLNDIKERVKILSVEEFCEICSGCCWFCICYADKIKQRQLFDVANALEKTD